MTINFKFAITSPKQLAGYCQKEIERPERFQEKSRINYRHSINCADIKVGLGYCRKKPNRGFENMKLPGVLKK